MNSIYDSRMLNLVIFSPLLVAALVMFMPKTEKAQIRGVTLLGMLLAAWGQKLAGVHMLSVRYAITLTVGYGIYLLVLETAHTRWHAKLSKF